MFAEFFWRFSSLSNQIWCRVFLMLYVPQIKSLSIFRIIICLSSFQRYKVLLETRLLTLLRGNRSSHSAFKDDDVQDPINDNGMEMPSSGHEEYKVAILCLNNNKAAFSDGLLAELFNTEGS